MLHGTARHAQTRPKSHQVGQARQVINYLIGTVGVAVTIAVAVLVAQRSGWLDAAQTALHEIKLPGLPSAPEGGLSDVLPGFANRVKKVGQSTTTLWQRGSERPQPLTQPSGVERRP
jgi:hypothetical protein